jgi:hypothetical protein
VEHHLKLSVSQEDMNIIVNQFDADRVTPFDIESKIHDYSQLSNVKRVMEQERVNKLCRGLLDTTDPSNLQQQF